ncbi:hypothetical protein BH10PSE8_BH10PSE8_18170 [soil metagenome]
MPRAPGVPLASSRIGSTVQIQMVFAMSTLVIVLLVVLLLGGGGYYGHRSYGTTGLGGVLGLALVVVLVLWFMGALGGAPVRV